MNSYIDSATRFLIRMSRELGEMAQTLDGTGWAMISGGLLVCGWFFLKGNKIRAA